jgi:hypothetical protein
VPPTSGHTVHATVGKIDGAGLLTSSDTAQSSLTTYLQQHPQSSAATTTTSAGHTGTVHLTDLSTASGVNLSIDHLKDHLVTAHQI